MKCPKCHYLSFDPEPRCRNCGYTLSLDDPDLDITLSKGSDDAPLVDLALRGSDAAPHGEVPWDEPLLPAAPSAPGRRPVTPLQVHAPDPPPRTRTSAPGPFDAFAIADVPEEPAAGAPSPKPASPPDIDDLVGVDRPSVQAPHVSAPAPASTGAVPTTRQAAPITSELPLFMKGMPAEPGTSPADTPPAASPIAPPSAEVVAPVIAAHSVPDEPLVRVPAEPRSPVAVRRPTSEPAIRPRAANGPRGIGPLDRDLLDDLERIEHLEERDAAAEARRARLVDAAGPVKRLGAALADGALLLAIGAGIVWTTLRWCDLSWADMSRLPVAPVAALLLLMALGYLFMFTAAGGQTLGKMLTGIRVVDAGAPGTGNEPLSLRQALYREVAAVPSVLVFGAGFVPALVGDERGLHDRLARTRVVRA